MKCDEFKDIKIVPGGQTGVDRGALEAAVDLGLEFGGWAPHGWIAEDGTIPAQYRERMQEHPSMGGMAILSYAAARENDIMRIVSRRPSAEAKGGHVRRPLTLGRAVIRSDKERTMRHES